MAEKFSGKILRYLKLENKKSKKVKNRITQTDQLTIGYLVKKILDEKNAEYATKIIEALNPFCQKHKVT